MLNSRFSPPPDRQYRVLTALAKRLQIEGRVLADLVFETRTQLDQARQRQEPNVSELDRKLDQKMRQVTEKALEFAEVMNALRAWEQRMPDLVRDEELPADPRSVAV